MTEVWRARHARAADGEGIVGFKRHLRSVVVPGEAVYLLSAESVLAVRGTSAEVVAPLLDGTRTLAALQRAASTRLAPELSAEAVRALTEAGLVRGHAPSSRLDPVAQAYWDHAGLDATAAEERLAGDTVRVIVLDADSDAADSDAADSDAADSDSDRAALLAACEAAGLRPSPTGGDTGADPVAPVPALTSVPAPVPAPALTLVLCTDYLDPRLRELDARQRESGVPWLPVKVHGPEVWIGPVLSTPSASTADPGPCWSCLASRLRLHRRSEAPLRRALGGDAPVPRPGASLAATRVLGFQLAALEAAQWLAGLRGPERAGLLAYDTLRRRSTLHPVRRRPQCPDCGDPGLVSRQVRRPYVPRSRPKAAVAGNGHRVLTPEQMLERHGHLVGPVTGVVEELRRDPRSPGFLDCYLSGHNLATEAHTLAGLRAGLRALSGGKGLDPAEARVSALCEAVERYSATRHGDEPVVLDTYRSLGADAIHPNACQLYDERQFRDRDGWNARAAHFQYVPAPFDEDRPTEWTPVWSLTAGRHRLLPTSLLYFDPRAADADGPRADSNGNAAGGSLEDAVLQGFMELVERDAVALWWYNRTRQPAVDLGAFDAPWVRRLIDGFRAMHRETWVLDLTTDLGVPALAAVSRRTDRPVEDIVFGFGAHFDPAVALRRALTELGQLLPAVAGARSDGTGYAVDDPEPRTWWRTATVARRPFLRPDPAAEPRTPASWAYTPRADLRDDIAAAAALVAARGMELLVLDQTRPDTGLPVVKVVVPGLRHFWARFGPGRLYDVPVALGRLAAPTPYDELNPIPLFV
ncbi:TOMM precursor leader peptide-binding protein [Streptomyces sp. NPDC001658]